MGDNTVRPGYATTEFWLTVLVSLGAFLAAIADVLPPKWAALALAGSVFAYNISRGLAKWPQPTEPPAVVHAPSVVVHPPESVPLSVTAPPMPPAPPPASRELRHG